MPRSCIVCGGPIPESAHRAVKFCSDACRRAYHASYVRRWNAARADRVTACLICGAPIPTGVHGRSHYCSDRCRNEAYRRFTNHFFSVHPRPHPSPRKTSKRPREDACPICGNPVAISRNRRYCSPECAEEARRRQHHEKYLRSKILKEE